MWLRRFQFKVCDDVYVISADMTPFESGFSKMGAIGSHENEFVEPKRKSQIWFIAEITL